MASLTPTEWFRHMFRVVDGIEEPITTQSMANRMAALPREERRARLRIIQKPKPVHQPTPGTFMVKSNPDP